MLSAQGFSQYKGLDYSKTFSPFIKATTIRLILTFALFFGWLLRKLNVKNAFLNGNLKGDVYIRQPIGFIDP